MSTCPHYVGHGSVWVTFNLPQDFIKNFNLNILFILSIYLTLSSIYNVKQPHTYMQRYTYSI